MVSNPRGQYWKVSPLFPVGIVNIDTLQPQVVLELKQEFEDASQYVGINLPLQVVGEGLCKFGENRLKGRKQNCKGSVSIMLGCLKISKSQLDRPCLLVTRKVAQIGLIRHPNDWNNCCARRRCLL